MSVIAFVPSKLLVAYPHLRCLSSGQYDIHDRSIQAWQLRTSSKVEAKIRLRSNCFAPFHELISSKLIRLNAQPC